VWLRFAFVAQISGNQLLHPFEIVFT
jgi:hypothetical protein